jgi:uncharacterized protein YndB with AHSA1/START domain
MTNVKMTTTIEAPVDRVFEIFTDVERAPDRVKGIKQVDMLTLGGFRLGARWREVREVMGHQVAEEVEVTAFERGHNYVLTDHAHGARADTLFTFEPFDGGTKVTVELDVEPLSLPTKLLALLGWTMTGKVRELLTRDLDDLRRVAEAPKAA